MKPVVKRCERHSGSICDLDRQLKRILGIRWIEQAIIDVSEHDPFSAINGKCGEYVTTASIVGDAPVTDEID